MPLDEDIIQTETAALATTAQEDAGQEGNSDDLEVQQQLQEKGAKTAESKAGIYIFPRPNALDGFPTYTYSISLYIMTDKQFFSYVRAPVRNINSYLLLLQSAGAPKNHGGPRANQGTIQNLQEAPGIPTAGRNPYFDVDYNIDNIEIKTLATPQKGHGGQEIRFQVTETENISFLDNLHRAVQDLNQSKGVKNLNYAKIFWLMVIRFYGYDENGVPIQIKGSNGSDPQAAIEKYYPFQVREIGFKIQNKDVVYDVVGVPLGHNTGLSSALGTIPADIELSGQTVGDYLIGNIPYSGEPASEENPGESTTQNAVTSNPFVGIPLVDETGQVSNIRRNPETGDLYDATGLPPVDQVPSAPPKATAAKSTTSGMRGGLMGIMNQIAEKNAKEKNFEFADQYELIFAPGAEVIRDALVTKAGNKTLKSSTPMQTPVTEETKNASPDTNAMETTVRNRATTAGEQLISVIEQIIRQSDYIANQAGVKVSETENKFIPNPAASKKGVNWFYVEAYAQPIDYDNKRNDYAYKMTFRVNTYRVSNLFSPFYYIPHFPGVHKSYPYWFTGKNTSVLQYEADFNKNFFFQITGETTTDLQKAQETAIRSMRDMVSIQSSAASGQSRQGAVGRANEIASSAADYLYSVASNNNVKMRIIGDPAWLAQGEYTGAITNTKKNAFLPDGTINFSEGQILFEIVWQRPDYYNLETGLQDPYAKQQSTKLGRNPLQSVVYQAVTVISYFRGGKFEQELQGTFYSFPKPDKTNAVVTPAPTSDQTPVVDSDSERALQNREDARDNALASLLLPSTGGALPAPDISIQPPSGSSGVNEDGYGVGILLPDETGQVGTIRLNPETGELYNAAGLPAPPKLSQGGVQPDVEQQVIARET